MKYKISKHPTAVLVVLLLSIAILRVCALSAPCTSVREELPAVIEGAYEKTGIYQYTARVPSVTDISDTEKRLWFYRDDEKLMGELFLPEGSGKFPVIVLSGGLDSSCYDYEDKAMKFAENGYAAVTFTYTPLPRLPSDFTDDSSGTSRTLSGTLDLYAVMDSLDYLPGVDTGRLYLWGHSFGGLVSAYAGCGRPDAVKGMILVEPSLIMGENDVLSLEPRVVVNIYDLMEGLSVDTLIFVGTQDGYGDDPHAYDRAMETLTSGELITIDGANHFFVGEYGDRMIDETCERMASWGA